MVQNKKMRLLICGILPPPFFGHSMMYHMLMRSGFVEAYDIIFLNMRFWSYGKHKKVTLLKLLKLGKYYAQFIFLIVTKRPAYVLYNMSFDRMPLLKDALFIFTGHLLGRRIVIHDMGQYLKELYEGSGWFFKILIKKMLAITTASIVLGEVTRKVYDGFLPRARTFSVHGAVEDSQEHLGQPSACNSNGRIMVLYFSFLSVSKGVWTALHGIPEVVRNAPDIRFVFGGPMASPELEQQFREYVAEQKLQDHVEYVGYVGDAEQRTALFRAADIFIFPTHRDVFGLVLLHALAEGVPVIASREGAIPEIIRDGENGYIFAKGQSGELAERIVALAADPEARERFARANRKRYEDVYTPRKYGQRMIEAFQKIVALERS